MILRKAIPISIFLCCCLSSSALAQQDSSNPALLVSPPPVAQMQDFNKTVLPLTELMPVSLGFESKQGTGFCLDPECRFIGTNYHVAVLARLGRIKGERVVRQYLATGPDDQGATVNSGPYVRSLKYNLSRDLAIFELRRPLRHHRGVAFSLDEMQVGQEVDIYAYSKGGVNPLPGLVRFHGTFKGQTPTDLLAFDYSLSADKSIRPGASGGIVVDSKTQRIVSILNGIVRDGEAVALAVPVRSLADFVSKVQPGLAQNIFPSTTGISAVSSDFYTKLVTSPASDVLQKRPDEPAEVKALRSKAQVLADSMRNFIAVQTFAWGSGDKEPAAVSAYEVRVLDGYQRFRAYPDGEKELENVPFPSLSNSLVTGGEWSELPELVGTERGLKIHQGSDRVVNSQRMKVFQYRADAEDGVCRFKSNFDFGFFSFNKFYNVACYGEVWTDEDTNILRMSVHYELTGKWKDYQAVVTYGWLQRADEAPRLIPVTISTQAKYKQKVYWCRGQFIDYQVFSSRVRLVAK